MEILMIHGSMRKGNTYHMAKTIADRLKSRGDVYITEISVKDLELPFCLSCHACFSKGEDACPHSGVIARVFSELKAYDALIVSGTVYSMHLNAAMKNVIDHLSFLFHRPCLFTKQGLVVTSTAGQGEKTVAKYLASTLGHWGISGVTRTGCKIRSDRFKLSQKQMNKLHKAADKFYKNVKTNALKTPSFNSVIVHNAFRGMCLADVVTSKRDREYWNETGLIGKVYPRKIGVIRSALGALVCAVMKRVINRTTEING